MNSSTLDNLFESYARVSRLNQRALAQLGGAAAAFKQNRIDFVLLKGADLVSRLYGVRGLRPIADVDLLVRERDLPVIDQILAALGYHQEVDGNPAYSLPDGLTLDLVTSIWYLDGTDALENLWQRSISRQIGTQRVSVMSGEDLLIYLTAYTVVHRAALSPRFANDLALLTQKEQLNWDFIIAEAKANGLRVPLHHGLSYARARQGLCNIPEAVLHHLEPQVLSERLMAFLLHKVVTERFVYGTGFFLLFLTRPGLKKWQWLSRAFFPSSTFLHYRYGTRAASRHVWLRLMRVFALLSRIPGVAWHIVSSLCKRSFSPTS